MDSPSRTQWGRWFQRHVQAASNMDQIRVQSLEKAQALGYAVNPSLPLLDQGELRALPEVTNRFLCLHAVVASSYGRSK